MGRPELIGLLATITGGSSPTASYFHDDQLSWRISTDSTTGSPTYGQVIGYQGHYPFGESWYSNNGNGLVFTSYQRDAESGLDYAMARYYDSTAVRFCSADPLGGQLDDPQTLNRYTYVRNDPVDLTDPNGKSWLSWLVDVLVGVAAVLLPEIAPEIFGQLAAADTATWGADQFVSQTINGVFGGATLTSSVTVTATASTFSATDAILGGAVAGAALQASQTPQVQLQQSQQDAQQRVQRDPCKSFIQNLQAKLNRGTAGVGNSSASSFASRVGRIVSRISATPSQQYPDALAVTQTGTYNVTFYPHAFSPGIDLTETFIHEAFHAGRFAKGDVDIYKAMTADRPHIPLTGTTHEQTEQASRLWNKELDKNCGSAGAQ
jgi:RHS repeat-associated protein